MIDIHVREPLDFHRGAVFTVELGCLVENGFDLGMTDYPIFDEAYREPLNAKICEHFWFREIGQETPQMFKRLLNRTMNEVMPYYNQLYKTTLDEFSPFDNYDITTTGNSDESRTAQRDYERDETATATASAKNASDATSRVVVSNTPQMQLSGREDYATSITDSKSANTATSDSDSTNEVRASDTTSDTAHTTNGYVTHRAGTLGITKSDALMRFRDTLLNIDMMVIHELDSLFMGIWGDYENML